MWRHIQKLYTRLFDAIGRGRVTLTDDSGGTQSAQVVLGPLETRDAVPRLAEYGFTSNPPEDTDAVMICLGGDRSRGIIIATGHQTYRLKGLQTGEVALYDDLGQKVYLTRTGIVIDGAGLPVKITNTPSITNDSPVTHCTGDLNVDGSIVAQGDISDHGIKTMAGMRAVFDTHDHTDPQGGTVSTPNSSM